MALSREQIEFLEKMFPAALQFLGMQNDMHFEKEDILAGRASKIAAAFLAERDRLINLINGIDVGVRVSQGQVQEQRVVVQGPMAQTTVTHHQERLVNHGNGMVAEPMAPSFEVSPNHGLGGAENTGKSRFNQKLFEQIMSVPECPICSNPKSGAAGQTCSHFHFPPHGTLRVPEQMG